MAQLRASTTESISHVVYLAKDAKVELAITHCDDLGIFCILTLILQKFYFILQPSFVSLKKKKKKNPKLPLEDPIGRNRDAPCVTA